MSTLCRRTSQSLRSGVDSRERGRTSRRFAWGLVALALAGCTARGHLDASADEHRDGAEADPNDVADTADTGGCPAEDPMTPETEPCRGDQQGLVCEYAAHRCRCEARTWYCESIECPAEPARTGMSCSQRGQVCNPTFENQCLCVYPEMVWYCCQPFACTYPDDGAMCCGRGPFACQTEDGGAQVRWSCTDDGHWAVMAMPLDAGTDADDAATSDSDDGDAAE